MDDHHQVRKDFLEILFEYIDLSLEKLKVTEAKMPLNVSIKNTKMEMKVLELWLAINTGVFFKDIAPESRVKRKQFFEFFNLTDRNYNDMHGNWIKKPKKTEFLKMLIENINHKYNGKVSTSPKK